MAKNLYYKPDTQQSETQKRMLTTMEKPPNEFQVLFRQYQENKISRSEIQKTMHVSSTTLRKYFNYIREDEWLYSLWNEVNNEKKD